MKHFEDSCELRPEQLEKVSVESYCPGIYRKEAIMFLKKCMDEKVYDSIMKHGDGFKHPYVAAKIYLGSCHWEKYVWIEQHGTLDGDPG